MNDLKQIPPASVRNTPPLLEVLTRIFAPARLQRGTVLEIASGSGYHASAFAAALGASLARVRRSTSDL